MNDRELMPGNENFFTFLIIAASRQQQF